MGLITSIKEWLGLRHEVFMKEVLRCLNRQLIIKYDNYYIRFIGGQYSEIPCDVKITKAEAEKIVNNPDTIVQVLDDYKGRIPWTASTFIQSGIEDYLYYEENYSKEDIVLITNRLDRYKRIKNEMYQSIMFEEFPVSGLVQICGKTAKDLGKERNLHIGKAYLLLLELAEKE